MQRSIFKSWSFLLFLLIAGSTLSAQQGSRTPKTNRSVRSNNYTMSIDTDSSVIPARTFVTYRDEDLYVMTLSAGKLVQLYVNGRQVPADSFAVYQPLVVKVREQIKRDSEQAVRDRQQAGRDKEQAERDQEQAVRDKHQAERDAEQAVKYKRAAEQDAQQAGRDKLQAERDAEQGNKDKQQAEKGSSAGWP